MNILYGIQGTGHGHISRAKELLPELSKRCTVDVLISGYACQLELGRAITYRKRGVSLKYDQSGGVAILKTLRQFKPIRFINDIQSIPLHKYDLVISDYEPVSSWAARIAGVPSVAMSHQAAFMSARTPRPARKSVIAEQLLQRFAPTDEMVGFHFRRYDDFIEPPVIREEIQNLTPVTENHVTVYLPAYHPAMLTRMLGTFRNTDWHVFSPECSQPKKVGNVHLQPVGQSSFLESLEKCKGVLTSAGFEMGSEAMYLGKKLLIVPIRNQYEQLCNATALEELGVPVLERLEGNEHYIDAWLHDAAPVALDEIADPAEIVAQLLSKASREVSQNRRAVSLP